MSQPPTSNPSTPRWQRRPEARPEEILDAAFATFGELGFARTKIEDVARLAGVSKGTVYLYFDSKEALFRAMVRARIVAPLAEAEEFVRSDQGPARVLLVELIRRTYARLRGDQMARIARIVQGELGSFPELARFYFDEVILRARRLFDSVLARGIETGEFRPEARAFAPRALSSLLVHTAQLQCFFRRCDPDALSDERMVEGLVDTVLHGVLARPAART